MYRCHLFANNQGDTARASLAMGSIFNHSLALACILTIIFCVQEGMGSSAAFAHHICLAAVGWSCWIWQGIQDFGVMWFLSGWSTGCIFLSFSVDVLTLVQSGHLNPSNISSLATSGCGPPVQGSGYCSGIFNAVVTLLICSVLTLMSLWCSLKWSLILPGTIPKRQLRHKMIFLLVWYTNPRLNRYGSSTSPSPLGFCTIEGLWIWDDQWSWLSLTDAEVWKERDMINLFRTTSQKIMDFIAYIWMSGLGSDTNKIFNLFLFLGHGPKK